MTLPAPLQVLAEATRHVRDSESCVICVPARNEGAMLPGLIDALRAQTVSPSTYSLCILLDGCRDGSDAWLRDRISGLDFPCHLGQLPPAPPNAGRARRAACRLGLLREPAATCLLTTDADTRPTPDWIETNLKALREADLVAGRIERENAGDMPGRQDEEIYLDRLHQLRRVLDPVDYDPSPSHPGLGGASLAVRRATYEALGGFAALATGEDVAFVRAARLMGWRVRHERAVHVVTSGRTQGRAPRGLAEELARYQQNDAPAHVPDPDEAAEYYRFQAWLRRAFSAASPAAPPPAGFETWAQRERLARLRAQAPSADAFVLLASPSETGISRVPLTLARARLASIEAGLTAAVAA